MQLFYQPEISLGHLSPDESRHAITVLRMNDGDEFDLTDGKGNLFKARVKGGDAGKCGFEIVSTEVVPRRNFSIHLAIAPTKNADRIEWMVEKCVEVGIEKISFLKCKTSERKSVNMERMEKIVVSAMKQSGQAWLPEISPMIEFEQFVKSCQEKLKFIAYVDAKNPNHLKNLAPPNSEYLVLIGPEGDFSKSELALAIATGFKSVSLGPTRLRTETAGLMAVTILNLWNS